MDAVRKAIGKGSRRISLGKVDEIIEMVASEEAHEEKRNPTRVEKEWMNLNDVWRIRWVWNELNDIIENLKNEKLRIVKKFVN